MVGVLGAGVELPGALSRVEVTGVAGAVDVAGGGGVDVVGGGADGVSDGARVRVGIGVLTARSCSRRCTVATGTGRTRK